MTIYRLCNRCGGTYPMAGRSTGKCPNCMREYEREKSQRRRAKSASARARDSAAWQHARTQARARDGGCTHRHTGQCAGDLAVHHITPLERGGTHHVSNLITLCRAHHEQAEPAFLKGGAPTHTQGVREKHSGVRDEAAKDSEGPSIG